MLNKMILYKYRTDSPFTEKIFIEKKWTISLPVNPDDTFKNFAYSLYD